MADRTASRYLSDYRFGDTYIGRLNEDSALTSAHPDDCALFAGPPRYEWVKDMVLAKDTSGHLFKLFGTFQAVSFSNTQNVVPAKAIGSQRFFFFTSNAPVTFGFSMLLMKTDNLLKVIHNNLLHNKQLSSAISTAFVDKVFSNFEQDNMWFNIESEIFSIPFGLGILWSNKERSFLGAAYIENAYLTGITTEIVAGRQMLVESGSFIGDRIIPFPIREVFEGAKVKGVSAFADFRDAVANYFGIAPQRGGGEALGGVLV